MIVYDCDFFLLSISFNPRFLFSLQKTTSEVRMFFEKCRQRLRKGDRFEKSDGAKETFDLWYGEARKFAQAEVRDEKRMAKITEEAMRVLLDTADLISSDSYAVRSITEEFGKLLSILRTKSKFSILVPYLKDFLFSYTMEKFIKILSVSRCSKDSRTCVGKTMNELLRLQHSVDSDTLSRDHIVRIVKILSDLGGGGDGIVDDSSLLRKELLQILCSVAFRT